MANSNIWQISQTQQTYPGGCTIVGSGLYHAAADSNKNIFITRIDLLMETDSWSNTEMLSPTQINFTNQVKPQTNLRPALINNPDEGGVKSNPKLYLFWADSGSQHNHNCYAAWAIPPSPNGYMPMWSQGIRLYKNTAYTTKGNSDQDSRLVIDKGSLSAVTLAGKVLLTHLDQTNNNKVCIRLYDPTQIKSDNTELFWAPEHSVQFTFDDLHTLNSKISRDNGAIGSDISSTLITFGPENHWLVIGLLNAQDKEVAIIAIPIDPTTSTPIVPANQAQYPAEQRKTTLAIISNAHEGVYLANDPAGRVRIYTNDSNGKLQGCTLSTDHLEILKISNLSILNDYKDITVVGVPAMTFSLSGATVTNRVTTMAMSELGLSPSKSGKDTPTLFVIGNYGTAQIEYNKQSIDYSSANAPYPWICQGLMDPFPLMTTDVQEINPNSAVFATTYGATKSLTKSHTVETSTAIGVTTSGKIELVAGASYELSVESSLGSVLKSEQRATLVDTKEGYSCIDNNRNALADMSIFASSMTLAVDYFTFKDSSGQKIEDGSIQIVVYPIPSHKQINTARAYTVSVPGTLDAWSKAGINQRMQTLFPAGSNYRNKYFKNGDYVGSVIEANALAIGPNGSKFIEIAVNASAFWSEAVQISNIDFVETSWSMSDSASVEVSVGYEFKQIGLEINTSTLAKVNFSTSNTSDTENLSEWGITITPQPCSERFGPVKPYSVRLYLLKASTQWVEELKLSLQAMQALNEGSVAENQDFIEQLDPNAAPWRIAYVVSY